MDFRVVVSDPGSGKAYQVELKDPAAGRLLGKRIGDRFEGDILGMPGYSVQITGGSDREGFPMRADLPGTSSSDLSGIVRINGLYDTNYKNNGSTSAFNYIESFNSSANVLASQMQMDVSLNNSRAIISGTNYYINTNFSALITGSSYYGTYASSLSAITALNFIVYGGQIAAGAKIDVYGYRR